VNPRLISLTLTAALLTGCAGKTPVRTVYDFGPLSFNSASNSAAAGAASGAPLPPVLLIADVTGPSWLDSQRMYYRLLYADAQQSLPYARHNWNATPLQLLGARLKSRVAEAGVKVLSASDGGAGVALLRVEVEDFSQNFDSAASSSGRLVLRASLFRDHRLVDQRRFSRDAAAASADAPGGARALAAAADAVAFDIIGWLAAQPPQKQ
jgi:cholesterol transport system auxiliary component